MFEAEKLSDKRIEAVTRVPTHPRKPVVQSILDGEDEDLFRIGIYLATYFIRSAEIWLLSWVSGSPVRSVVE
jgi:hypothetical protein